MENKLKKVYFAGKFNMLKDKSLPLEKRLENDFRSLALGDSKLLTYASKDLKLSKNYIYLGPFYCESASNGNFTSTDCNVVLNSEYEAVNKCDVFFALFDLNFSVGTIVELCWAIEMQKEIIIFYKEEASSYEIKSEYWFAIADALKRAKNLRLFSFKEEKEVIEFIKENMTND